MQGVLLIDKPEDWTSFDVVNFIRRLVATAEQKKTRQIKVGHTGTLDPFATGLLIVLIGKVYTKQAAALSGLNKTYEFTIKLGEISSTGDPEGTIQKVSRIIPTKQAIEQTLNKFTGTLQQVPPIYSAIKINGQRSYMLARQGKDIQMKAREITVLSLRLLSYTYPYVTLSANVSPGTYIRTLAEDIGKSLGTGAYTTRLRRCGIGRFEISQACPVSGLSAEQIEHLLVDL